MSLINMIAFGCLHGDSYFRNPESYDSFINKCSYSNFEKIQKYASVDFLTKRNFYAFEILAGYADLECLKYIVENFVFNFDLYLGLVSACKYGNYINFLYLFELVNPSIDQINKLLEKTVQGYSRVKYKQTQILDIYLHLLKLVENPNYNKLLELNTSALGSSFDIFTDLINKSTDVNLIKIFKSACLSNNIEKAEQIYASNKDLITEYVNLDQNLFINLCKRNKFNCVDLYCKINKNKNYSTSISAFTDAYGCYDSINYRIKDNSGNIVLQHICVEEKNPNKKIEEFDKFDY